VALAQEIRQYVIDNADPLIVAVTQEEFDVLKSAYEVLSVSFVDARDGSC
jgi:hypothetical protein